MLQAVLRIKTATLQSSLIITKNISLFSARTADTSYRDGAFALCTVMTFIAIAVWQVMILIPLAIAFLVLLVPYIKHYYFLEIRLSFFIRTMTKYTDEYIILDLTTRKA